MKKKHTKGLTLMELTIVLAIMVIIAAIAVPAFLLSSDRARLRADIQSARVIQQAIELYRIERGDTPDGTDEEDVLETLEDAGYLNLRRQEPQTSGANWAWNNATARDFFVIDIRASSSVIHEIYADLAPYEQVFVRAP